MSEAEAEHTPEPRRVRRSGAGRRRRGVILLAELIAVLLVLDLGTIGHRVTTGGGSSPQRPVETTATGSISTGFPAGVGVIGPYTAADLATMKTQGVRQALLELSWAQAEPADGQYDTAYLTSMAAQAATLRADGFQVALNTGIYEAPAWVMAEPGARYVAQDGSAYDLEPLPNLVFDADLRTQAQDYLDTVFARLGTDFSLVRAGGGHFGELGYPFELDATGAVRPLYWAFDANAQEQSPVPGWKPGQPSPAGQAQRFLGWYFASLTAYQNWQVNAVRHAGYTGWVAMLYPSFGLDPDDTGQAVAANLDGSSPGERSGEVQRGYDWNDQVAALYDPKVVVWGTWGERSDALSRLVALARARGLPVMAENTGDNTDAQLDEALRTARALQLQAFWLVRASSVASGAGGGQLGRLTR